MYTAPEFLPAGRWSPFPTAPPQDLAASLSPREDACILQLSQGIHDVLYTVSRHSGDRNFKFVVPSGDEFVLARDATLASLMVAGESVGLIWQIYYHQEIDEEAERMLKKHLAALAASSRDIKTWPHCNVGNIILVDSRDTLSRLNRVFSQWLEVLNNQDCRRKVTSAWEKSRAPRATCPPGFSWRDSTSAAGQARESIIGLTEAAHLHYWETGTTLPATFAGLRLNPLFAFSKFGEGWHLDFECNPFGGFHLSGGLCARDATLRKDENPLSLLVSAAHHELELWGEGFRSAAEQGSVRILFAVSGPLEFCAKLKGTDIEESGASLELREQRLRSFLEKSSSLTTPMTFNVINTVGLCDVHGWWNVFLHAIPVLSDSVSSTLITDFTAERTSLNEAGSQSCPLAKLLNVDPFAVSTIFGLERVVESTGWTQDFQRGGFLPEEDGADDFYVQTVVWKKKYPFSENGYNVIRLGASAGPFIFEFDARQIAVFLSRIYSKMFPADQESVTWSDVYHDSTSTKATFALLMQQIRERSSERVNWAEVIALLNLGDDQMPEELLLQLEIHDFETGSPSLEDPSSLTCANISIPVAKFVEFKKQAADFVGAPKLRIGMVSTPGAVPEYFSSLQLTFGKLEQPEGDYYCVPTVAYDKQEWSTKSPYSTCVVMSFLFLGGTEDGDRTFTVEFTPDCVSPEMDPVVLAGSFSDRSKVCLSADFPTIVESQKSKKKKKAKKAKKTTPRAIQVDGPNDGEGESPSRRKFDFDWADEVESAFGEIQTPLIEPVREQTTPVSPRKFSFDWAEEVELELERQAASDPGQVQERGEPTSPKNLVSSPAEEVNDEEEDAFRAASPVVEPVKEASRPVSPRKFSFNWADEVEAELEASSAPTNPGPVIAQEIPLSPRKFDFNWADDVEEWELSMMEQNSISEAVNAPENSDGMVSNAVVEEPAADENPAGPTGEKMVETPKFETPAAPEQEEDQDQDPLVTTQPVEPEIRILFSEDGFTVDGCVRRLDLNNIIKGQSFTGSPEGITVMGGTSTDTLYYVEVDGMDVLIPLHLPFRILLPPEIKKTEEEGVYEVVATASKGSDDTAKATFPTAAKVRQRKNKKKQVEIDLWNSHRVNLDLLPTLRHATGPDPLPGTDIWLNELLRNAWAPQERVECLRSGPGPGFTSLQKLKLRVSTLFSNTKRKKPTAVMIQSGPSKKLLLILIGGWRLDTSTENAILDTAIIPYQDNLPLRGVRHETLPDIHTDEDVKMLSHFAVQAVETCRTYDHDGETCEYIQQESIPLMTDIPDDRRNRREFWNPICTCGAGKQPFPEEFEEISEWKRVLPFATRAAIPMMFHDKMYTYDEKKTWMKTWAETAEKREKQLKEMKQNDLIVNLAAMHGRADQCAVCQKTGEMQKCARCERRFYCSRECQKKDWKLHKVACQKQENR